MRSEIANYKNEQNEHNYECELTNFFGCCQAYIYDKKKKEVFIEMPKTYEQSRMEPFSSVDSR